MADTILRQSIAGAHVSVVRAQTAQKLFNDGCKQLGNDHPDYAASAFAAAICSDPSQRHFAKELLAVLSTGSIVQAGVAATAWPAWRLKRRLAGVIAAADWQLAFGHGTKLLLVRARSISALLGLGQACAALKFYDSAVVYLRHAHRLRPHDVLVNRHCGRVLGKVNQFDEAIACWSMVRQRLPRDQEALRETGRLAVKKTLGT